MFYYARDYVRSLRATVLVLTNERLDLGTEFEELETVRVGLAGYVRMLPWLMRSAVFTPTPHPLPFVDRQVIVVHDSYPFTGFMGNLKLLLIRLSLATSRCKAAYINQSDSRRVVDRILRAPHRKLFLPNHLPPKVDVERPSRRPNELTVGLVGTDSPKKNYDELMDAVNKANARGLNFIIYGTHSEYLQGLARRFPEVKMQLMLSSMYGFAEFFAAIDCLVSVATNEGFSRPIAAALRSGVPCLLREDEVFEEFYKGAASFYPTVAALVADLRLDKEFPANCHFEPLSELNAAMSLGASALDGLSYNISATL